MTAFALRTIFLVTFLLLWLSFVQAYCVYNYLDQENSSIYVEHEGVPRDISFKKTIGNQGKECCPYDNKSCNLYLRKDSTIKLKAVFNFGDGIFSQEFHGICTGGAGIGFFGSNINDVRMVCSHADGRVVTFTRKDWEFIFIVK